MYDVLVVGARCAGAPTAMLLARKGYRVLLADKATFPSGVPRCHFIHIPGIVSLKRWGLLDTLIASHCPPVHRIQLDVGSVVLAGMEPAINGQAAAFGPRRTVLDHMLVQAAALAGAEIREDFLVEELLLDAERVTGIRGHTPSKAAITEQARIVVGADGLHSLVARSVQAPIYHARPALTCGYFSYWSGVPITACELYVREQRVIYAFPTNDGLTCIAIQSSMQDFHTLRADIEGNFFQTLTLAPDLDERVRHGKREERFLGSGDLPNFYRKAYGAGWALVGDAGYHKDPYTAQGITDAFRDAEGLAEAIDAGLADRIPLEDALADYERQRNEITLPIYGLTRQLAALEPVSPQLLHLLNALQGQPGEISRFLGMLSGATPLSAFYSPEQIAHMIAD
jgi:2-polyprenyl-6-methoxyphenol hydroxylase-like FAD-dependent oxidoreductase